MKFVVDSNQLRTPQLRSFLEKSAENIAVLPDFVSMEAYKGDSLNGIFKSMSVLSDFPNQVILLKGTSKVLGLVGRRKGLQRRLIDEYQTKIFPAYIIDLRAAELGNTAFQDRILELGQAADKHLGKMRVDAINIRDAIEASGRTYSKEDLAALRKNEEYTSNLIGKLVSSVIEITGKIYQDSPLVNRRPSYKELPNTFMFRATLANYLLGLRRFSNGAYTDTSPEKLKNDAVDMMLVAYGTYFDGLMSADKNVTYMFQETRLLLSGLLDAEIPSLTLPK